MRMFIYTPTVFLESCEFRYINIYFLALLDYVSIAHEIKIRPASVRLSSVF